MTASVKRNACVPDVCDAEGKDCGPGEHILEVGEFDADCGLYRGTYMTLCDKHLLQLYSKLRAVVEGTPGRTTGEAGE